MTLIAQLVSTFDIGGAETLALQLSKAIAEEGIVPLAIAVRHSGPLEDRFRDAHIETLVCGQSRCPGLDIPNIWRLSRMLKKHNIQVLHCHNRVAHIYGAFAAKLARIPVVVCTRHSALTEGNSKKVHLLERLAIPLTDHFIAVSQNVMEISIEMGRLPRDRSVVIRNGIDTSRFTPSPHRPPGVPVIICVARLDPIKSHNILLEAISLLRDKGLDLKLRIVGDGPSRQALETQATDLRLGSIVEFLGPRSDVPDLLTAADIFVLPSKSEGLPMTIIEAMACGLPVIASDVGGVNELVTHNQNGLLVPAENVTDMAQALEQVVTDQSLQKEMGRVGRERVEAEFDIRVTAQLHIKLFRDLLKQKGIAGKEGP